MPDPPMERPGEDPAMSRAVALFKESGLSLAALGERMGYSKAIARQAAWQFMKTKDPRIGMLRKFAKAVGVDLEELTPGSAAMTQVEAKKPRMSRKQFVATLALYGIEMGPEEFREYLEEQHALLHPAWTPDDLLCHPTEAAEFCVYIRGRLNTLAPDDFILRSLLNSRKAH